MHIDEIDRRIIASLVQRGRASFRELGEAISLSSTSVKRRFDRLVATGAITGFTATVDPQLVGWRTEAFVTVTYRRSVPPAKSRAVFAEIPEIVEAHTVSGAADVMVRIRTVDVESFERVLEKLRALPQVSGTSSTMVLTTLLSRPSAAPSRPSETGTRGVTDGKGRNGQDRAAASTEYG